MTDATTTLTLTGVAEPAHRTTPPGPARTPAALPAGSHQAVIDILATMVLASAQETLT